MYIKLQNVLCIGLFAVCGSFAQSPCPQYFDYKSDNNGVYGEINLRPLGQFSTLQLQATFTIGDRLPTSFTGSIQPVGSDLYLLQNYNRGVPLQYRVNFPTTSPLPKLVKLTVNDNVICYGPGDVPGQYNYVTTITLQHMLFYKSGSDAFHEIYSIQAPTPKPDLQPQPEYTPNNDYNNLITHTSGQQEWDKQAPAPTDYPDYPKSTKSTQAPVTTTTPRPTVKTTTTTTTTTEIPAPVFVPQRRPVEYGTSNSLECGVNGSNDNIVPLIYQGNTYDKGEWPWLVALYKTKFTSLSYICAGTLISNRHVVTAAHCMQRKSTYTAMKSIVVKAGVYNLEDWSDDVVTRNLAGATIHESYNSSTLANDILVLTLDKNVPFNTYIKPACLWSGSTELNKIVGISGIVAGWGANEMGPGGKGEPRMVTMPIVSTAACRASKLEFHRLTSSKTLCAGDHSGAGPCLGDSGGGLYIFSQGRWRLRGVVSLSLWSENGESICNLNDYVVFTDTAQYLQWISDVIKKSVQL